MMQLILASALRTSSAGKGSPGVPTRHVPLNCMTGNVKTGFIFSTATQQQSSSDSLPLVLLLTYSKSVYAAWLTTSRPARASTSLFYWVSLVTLLEI